MTNQASRRAFLKRASALGVAGVAAPWAINLMSIAEAAAATATDYKALVCVFLYGGNDYANTVVPYDAASYALYQQLRPTIAYARDALTATVLAPSTPVLDSAGAAREFALAPALAPLLPIFNAGYMGLMLNVGPLVQPTTQAVLAQRPAVDLAVVRAGRFAFGLGRPPGRPVRVGQWQRYLHLRQRLRQRGLHGRQDGGAVPGVGQRIDAVLRPEVAAVRLHQRHRSAAHPDHSAAHPYAGKRVQPRDAAFG
jgi:hypothetical protein